MDDLDTLAQKLLALPPPPAAQGRLVELVVRPARGERRRPAAAWLTAAGGVEGDRWRERAALHRGRYAQRQVTGIRADVAAVLSGALDPMWTGDNLHLHLDLSTTNLPTGSRLQVGGAVLEVSAKPHMGCRRFRARFGEAAARINSDPRFAGWRLRGVMLTVVADGIVRPSDRVVVLQRA